MEEAINNFPAQLSWEPVVKNAKKLRKADKFIVCGMGGSHLAAGFLRVNNPYLDLLIHRDYGLPRVPEYFLKQSLVIICSHSGETEETVSAFWAAYERNLKIAVIAGGGKLLELAKEKGVAYVQVPSEGIQHRMAVGYFVRALAKLMRNQEMLDQVAAVGESLKPEELKRPAETLASRLKGRIPLIYTTNTLYSLAYAWKVNFNETSKVPAFVNVIPELNHNEISGFGLVAESLPNFRQHFYCLLLRDTSDNERIRRRFEITEALYESQEVLCEAVEFSGQNAWEKIFASFLLGALTSVALAKSYNLDPEVNPVIEDFKARFTRSETGTGETLPA